MKKRLLSFLLALLFILPTATFSFAEGSVPTSLEAPKNVNARIEDGAIYLRWTVPQSVLDYSENTIGVGEIIYAIDYKINNGPWKYGGSISEEILNSYDDNDDQFKGYVEGMKTDVGNVQETFFVYFHFGIADGDKEKFELMNDTYTFRMRFAFNDYEKEGENYLTSSYSNEASIGGKAQASPPTSLAAPTNLKAEVKKNTDGSPYFYLTWANPTAVDTVNKSFPIEVKVDFKVGNDKWYSEIQGHDWWSGNFYDNKIDFDPVKLDIADKIVIEENTYYFRVLYAYEPTYGNHVYSQFSNIVPIGVQKYESASPWATKELDKAAELGLITDKIKGKMNAPITREEFAEVAVNFYQLVTGKKAEPHPTKTFTDCKNPEVLKAFNLGITAGVGDGTKFEPNSYLLRQQMAAMITRTLKACYQDLVFDVSGVPDFKDQKLILAYANTPTKFMAKYKITVGDGKGNFTPNENCTREQAIAFLLRAYLNSDQYLPQ